jgi:Asp-tRNA(Asn)/Glu-tRNA(Gln) amidotransferase A subunit family amidase
MDMSATELAGLVNARTVSPVSAVLAAFDRINRLDPIINAFSYVSKDLAMRDAKNLEARLAKNASLRLPLAGVPLGVKDLEDCADMPTSFGCELFKNNVAKEDSVQVARLKAAGCIAVGKTNTPICWSQSRSRQVCSL